MFCITFSCYAATTVYGSKPYNHIRLNSRACSLSNGWNNLETLTWEIIIVKDVSIFGEVKLLDLDNVQDAGLTIGIR